MAKVTIEKVYRGKKETKFGQKDNVAIKVNEISVSGINVDGRWISTFKTKGTEEWKEGMIVDIEVTENKGFLNFNMSSPNSIESRVERLEKAVFGERLNTQEDVVSTVQVDVPEVNSEEDF